VNKIIQFCLFSRVKLGVDITQYVLSFLIPSQEDILEIMFKEYGGLHCECHNHYDSHNHFIDIKNFGLYDDSLHVDEKGNLTKLIIDHWDECCGDWDNVLCYHRSKDQPYPTKCRLLKSMCFLSKLEKISIRCVNFSKDTTIPKDIWKLKNLTVLDLSHIDSISDGSHKGITGRIPVGLKYLNLKELRLLSLCLTSTNISPILEIKTLELLCLSDIFEDGLFCDITNLDFSKLQKLIRIRLCKSFSGKIPKSLSNLSNIESLSIRGEHIEGVVPESIFAMQKINHLYIKGNVSLNFTGDLEYKRMDRLHVDANPLEITGNPPEMYEDFNLYPWKHDVPIGFGRL